MRKVLPTSASLILTENCNLACTYCFEKHNNKYMSDEVIVRSIDWLSNNALEMNLDNFGVILFGGEPLLNPKGVKKALEYGYHIATIKKLRFDVSIITNATVMSSEIYSLLKEYRDKVNLNIQLSVDGIPEVQNEYRITKQGKPSFDIVSKNIPIFQQLYDNNIDDKRLSIHGCINKRTLPKLYDSYSFFRDVLGFKQIWFLAISEEQWDENDVAIYDEQCSKIFKSCINDIEQSKSIKESFNYAPFSRYASLGHKRSAPCGAGNSFVSISTDGGIYPCHQIYFHDEYNDTCFGNVKTLEVPIDMDKRRIFLRYDEEDLGCGDCPNSSCYRCLAANWVHKGAMLSQIKGIYCKMSSIEYKYQLKMQQYVQKYNAKINTINDDCLCNCREGMNIAADDCDIVKKQSYCQSGNNPNNADCLCDMRAF